MPTFFHFTQARSCLIFCSLCNFRRLELKVGVADAEELAPEQPAPEPDPGRAPVTVVHPEGTLEPLPASLGPFYPHQIAN